MPVTSSPPSLSIPSVPRNAVRVITASCSRRMRTLAQTPPGAGAAALQAAAGCTGKTAVPLAAVMLAGPQPPLFSERVKNRRVVCSPVSRAVFAASEMNIRQFEIQPVQQVRKKIADALVDDIAGAVYCARRPFHHRLASGEQNRFFTVREIVTHALQHGIEDVAWSIQQITFGEVGLRCAYNFLQAVIDQIVDRRAA